MTLTAAEQLMLEYVNRARLDPLGEAERFGIDLNDNLPSGTLDGAARQVLAHNDLIHMASEDHGQWILDTNTFSHTGEGGSTPRERIEEAGYTFSNPSTAGENLTYSGSSGSIDSDALARDNHHRDLFLSSGHRSNMLNPVYREAGIAQELGTFSPGGSGSFNVSMIVQKYAKSEGPVFITGVSYADTNNNNFYSIGEGRGGTVVSFSDPAGGLVSASTAPTGGYALKVAASSNVAVNLGPVTLNADLSQGNAKLDLVNASDVKTSVSVTMTSAASSVEALGVANLNLTGHAGEDNLIGNKGNNLLNGAGGNDILTGGLGNDTLDGGAGNDIAVINAARAGVAISQGASGAITLTSSQGTDVLSGIEQIAFTDSTVNVGSLFPSGNLSGDNGANTLTGGAHNDFLYGDGFRAGLVPETANQVYRMYQATLDRAPDLGGYANWTKQLFEGDIALAAMAAGFVGSAEFQNTYGALSNEAFVELLYQNVLNRAADSGGLAAWTGALNNGMSREDVVLGFSESQEFRNNTTPAAEALAKTSVEVNWSDEVYRIYRATLDREPDVGGFTNWVTALSTGTPFTAVISSFVNSAEFQATYGALSNGGFVELLYQNVLDRSADASGLANWTNQLNTGTSRAEVVRGFSESAEFKQNTAADLEAWMRTQGVHDTLDGQAGNDVLAGGLLSDLFIFDATQDGENRVLDLEVWDSVQFNNFGYSSDAQIRANMAQDGADVVFDDQGVVIRFEDITLGQISDDMLAF